MDSIDTARRIAGWAGWGTLAFVAFATLSPIEMRPKIAGIGFEHFAAFGSIGFLFAFAYPRHLLGVALVVIVAAVALEAAQLLAPGRHGRVIDASIKIVGGLAGLGIAWVVQALLQHWRS